MKDHIGLQLYSMRDYFHDAGSLARTTERIREMGYKGIELAGLDSIRHSEALSVIRDSGLCVIAAHVPFSTLAGDLRGVIQRLHDYECTEAVIPLIIESKYRCPEGLESLVQKIHLLSSELSAEGIQLHYHNHNQEMERFAGRRYLDAIFEETSPRELLAELDTYWIQVGGGDPIEFINKYRGRQKMIHLKDAACESHRLSDEALGMRLSAGVGAEIRVTECGNGNMNLKGILKAAKQAGLTWYIVEMDEAYGKTMPEACQISYDNILALMNEVEGE